jgi:hypothetical protein
MLGDDDAAVVARIAVDLLSGKSSLMSSGLSVTSVPATA